MTTISPNQPQWTLKHQFLISQINRIDHPDYFFSTFTCPDIDTFIQQITTPEDAFTNSTILNTLFDRLLAPTQKKTIYVRLKWLLYLHKLIQLFKEGSVMYQITVKVLERYSEKFQKIFKGLQHYQRYLVRYLFKPYMQYLMKLTTLSLEKKCENVIPSSSFKRQISFQTEVCQPAECKEAGYAGWFRNYNLILSTLEGLGKQLKEFEPFFASELPFLCNMRSLIATDLQKKLKCIKNQQIPLTDLNMTASQLDSISKKINAFSLRNDKNQFDEPADKFTSDIKDCSKEDADSFMISPLKIDGRSMQSTLSFLNDQ